MAGLLSTQPENCRSADERMREERRLRGKGGGNMGKRKCSDVMKICFYMKFECTFCAKETRKLIKLSKMTRVVILTFFLTGWVIEKGHCEARRANPNVDMYI